MTLAPESAVWLEPGSRTAPALITSPVHPARMIVPAPAAARYQHLGWPKLVRTPGGVLVLACSAARWHGAHGQGCPAVALSHDEGHSFGPLRVLKQFDEDTPYTHCGNMALGVDEDGAIVLLAMAFRQDVRNAIFGWRSSDQGQTWSGVDTRALEHAGSVFGNVFAVPGRGLAVAGHHRPESQPRQQGFLIEVSQDSGRTWGAPQPVCEQRLVEPAVIHHRDGRLIGLIRDDKRNRAAQYWQAVSEDAGCSWRVEPGALSDAETAPERWRFPSPCLVTSPRDADRLFALRTLRHTPGSRPGRIELWTADADALDWRAVRTLVTFPEGDEQNTDFGYPWLAFLDDRSALMAFYCGMNRGANAIYAVMVEFDR